MLTAGTAKAHAPISSDLIRGTQAFNFAGEHLGTIVNIMIDWVAGQAAHAVMSSGGFLGIGERYHPLPRHVLKFDRDMAGYVVDLDKRRLTAAPACALPDPMRWEDGEWRKRLDEFYKRRGPAC